MRFPTYSKERKERLDRGRGGVGRRPSAAVAGRPRTVARFPLRGFSSPAGVSRTRVQIMPHVAFIHTVIVPVICPEQLAPNWYVPPFDQNE